MKTNPILHIILLFTVAVSTWAQSTNQNYIKTTVYKEPFLESNLPTNPTLQQAVVQVSYYDGLGRPKQNVAVGQSANDKDIVTPIEYDAFGRQAKDYLPYETNAANGQYYEDALLPNQGVFDYYHNQPINNTDYPYSQKQLENSPLDRVLKQAAPGNDWALGTGHEIKFGYDANTANEVRLFQVTTTWVDSKGLYDIVLNSGTIYYQPAQLYKNTTIDENTTATNSDRSEEFKDKEGRVVLKRVWARTGGFGSAQPPEAHDTYYVYDIYGNLTYVLPPVVDTSGTISADVLNGLCYQYKYDHRNRLVAKKIPGKTWEYIVYDQLDRVRATGPVLSPFTNVTGNGWLFTKYDAFNRPVITAWQADTNITETTRKTLQDQVISTTYTLSEQKATANVTFNTIVHRYTNTSYPKATTYHILTLTYYDDYNFPNPPTSFADVLGQPVRNATNGNCKGLVTGSWVRLLETTAMPRANLTTTLYKNDRNASPISTKTLYHNNGYGYTQTNAEVNFQGQVTHTETRHKRLYTSTELVVNEYFTYSPQGRPLTHTHRVNNNPIETLAANQYDALGQLLTKKVGRQADNPLQTVNYLYNIRGWLTDINNIATLGNDLFAFGIRYNTGLQTGSTALYNGNIAETHWKSESDNLNRMYRYNYDGLNRLLQAHYANLDVSNTQGNYNESLSYDKNGNILTLNRTGFEESSTINVPIDNLLYDYDKTNKNQLKKVVDLSNSQYGFKDDVTNANELQDDPHDDYYYDMYGNMTQDQNKHIVSIKYNHLNLPMRINFDSGSYITYLYDASGVKSKKTVYTQATPPTTSITESITEYKGMFQYTSKANGLGGLQFIFTPEGYYNVVSVSPSGDMVGAYVYNYTDHLGNIRLSYTWDDNLQELATLEEHHYYPFGLEHVTQIEWNIVPVAGPQGIKPTFTQVANNGYQYQYNGKEWQDELGLNWYDYGARNYDASLGRWMNVDNKSEIYFNYSPYSYAANIPTFFIDPNGEYIYLHYYLRNNHKNGEHDKEADQMFWAAAMTRAVDFINSDESSTGDILIFRAIDNMDDLESTIENDIADNKETYGETAEFGLWSHGGTHGPFKYNENGKLDQLNIDKWSKIDFNWSSNANAYFYGCRTARPETENDGKSFVEKLSDSENMRNVNVWGQTTQSWPSPYTNMRLSTDDIQNGTHHVPTYLVGSSRGLGDRMASILQVPSQSTPMAIYKNGFFQHYSHQPGRLMPKNRPISIPLNMHYRR